MAKEMEPSTMTQKAERKASVVYITILGLLALGGIILAYRSGTQLTIYWLVILAPGLPFFLLELSYGRILEQKRHELRRKFETSQSVSTAYTQAYGVEALQDVLKEFHHWKTYIVPITLTAVVASAIAAVALAMIPGVDLGLPKDLMNTMGKAQPAMLAGAAGAYLWALYGLLKRYGSADVSSTVLHYTWLQVAIGASVGAIAAPALFVLTPKLLLLGAFVLGGLPFHKLEPIIRKAVGMGEAPAEENPSMSLIQGMTPEVRQRLDDEDIDSVQRMAYSDPIRLLFRTNIEWNVILDLIDQAILINFVGERISRLRTVGIRGAIEVAELYHRKGVQTTDGVDQADARDADNAEKMFRVIGLQLIDDSAGGGALERAEAAAYNCAYQFANDPVVDFVWEHWMASYSELDVAPNQLAMHPTPIAESGASQTTDDARKQNGASALSSLGNATPMRTGSEGAPPLQS
jgi:hypothetical protein